LTPAKYEELLGKGSFEKTKGEKGKGLAMEMNREAKTDIA